MKKHFPGFYPLESHEVEHLLVNATIVFDANSLLDLFRLKQEYVEAILSVMESSHIRERLWLPYDVAWFYHYNMNGEILKQIENINSALSHLIQCKDTVMASKKYPYLEQRLTETLQTEIMSMEEICNRQKNELTETLKGSVIKNRINILFEEKIGQSYENAELGNIYANGEERYSHSIPPGYTAERCVDNRVRFHDLIVWKQLQKYAREQRKNVLLVTGNVKKDWYYIVGRKVVSPRNELINEFQKETDRHFYCVSMRQFIEKCCANFSIVLTNYSNLISQLSENIEYTSADTNYVGSNNNQGNSGGNSI